MTRFAAFAAASSLALLSLAAAPFAQAAPLYTQVASIPLGAPDRWDYVVAGPDGRVYVAHGDKVAVISAAQAKLIGDVQGVEGGTHGTGVSPASGQGFTDDGRNGAVVVFDLHSLKVTKTLKGNGDDDAVAYDPSNGHVFVVEGDPAKILVVNAKFDTVTATIDGGEKLEYAVSDGKGTLYVAGVEKNDLVRVDERTNQVSAHWPTPGCLRPHGLAYDAANHRAYMGCANAVMVAVDTRSGKTVATLPIGKGNDAVAFDPVRKRVFATGGADGTVSVYAVLGPDNYKLVDTLKTAVSGRTLDVDPKTGRVFVPVADVDPPAQPGGRPKARPGTLHVLVFAPAR